MAIRDIIMPEDLTKVPEPVADRIKRARARTGEERPKNRECLKMWRGEQYVFQSGGTLTEQAVSTTADGRGKPPYRVRTKRNLLIDIASREVAAAVQRVPNYEVDPSTTDPEDVDAARLAGKVARFGYDKWDIRSITEEVASYAVVTQGGFAWPFWDSDVAPYIETADGVIGQGEVGIRVFGPDETGWEPGLKFHESRWHTVEQARTPESVMQMDGFLGGALKANAESSDSGTAKLVLVTEYLERPSKKFPSGRWMTIANDKQIVPERPFPCQDEKGQVVDEPVLHYLCYFTDPDSDRDMGIVEHLIDAQRTINHTTNKQLEWLHLAMMPQLILRNLKFAEGRVTDEPGQVYHAVGPGEVTWREPGKVPEDLSQLKEEARQDMAQIAAQNEIPSQVSSGQGIQSLIERDQSRRYPFVANLAEFHARLMRHCLYLVQKHYTEERLLKVRGRFGPENISGFLGSQLNGQADVVVLPGSIEPRSRAQVEQRVMTFAQLGWIGPEEAMAAINGGTAEGLIQGYEEDVARANLIIQKLRAGPDVLFNVPMRQAFPSEMTQLNPMTGQMEPVIDLTTGLPLTELPGWLPRPFDDIRVQKTMMETWMKTVEWDQLDPASQEAASNYYSALLSLEQGEAQRQAMLQTQQAQDMGMQNAAKPQNGATQMPSLPGTPSQGPSSYQQ